MRPHSKFFSIFHSGTKINFTYHANASYPGRCVPGVLLCFQRVGGVDSAVQMRGVEHGVPGASVLPKRRRAWHAAPCLLMLPEREQPSEIYPCDQNANHSDMARFAFSVQPYDTDTVVSPRLHEGDLRHRGMETLAQGHTANEGAAENVHLTQSRFQNPSPQPHRAF